MLQANIGCGCWLSWSCAVHPKNHVHIYYGVMYGNASHVTGPLWGEPTFLLVDSLHNGSPLNLFVSLNKLCINNGIGRCHDVHLMLLYWFFHMVCTLFVWVRYQPILCISFPIIPQTYTWWNEKKTLSTERLSLPGKHCTCGTICVSTTTVFHPLILPSVSQFPLTGDLHVTVRGPISKYEPKMAALSESFIHWINSNYPPTACHVVCNSSGRTKLLVTKETILKWFPQWKIFRCWCQFHYVFHEGYDDNHGKTIWVSIMNLSWEIHCYMWITQWWLWLFLS